MNFSKSQFVVNKVKYHQYQSVLHRSVNTSSQSTHVTNINMAAASGQKSTKKDENHNKSYKVILRGIYRSSSAMFKLRVLVRSTLTHLFYDRLTLAVKSLWPRAWLWHSAWTVLNDTPKTKCVLTRNDWGYWRLFDPEQKHNLLGRDHVNRSRLW